jgi:hypothetical protein
VATIANGANRPLFDKSGTVPDLSGALQDYFQNMTFDQITKTTKDFQVVETTTPVNFRGVIMPLSDRQLFLKPEGQRAWTWFLLYSDPVLQLNVDDVVLWKGVQTRVMALKDWGLNGYIEYHLVQDWTGSGP